MRRISASFPTRIVAIFATMALLIGSLMGSVPITAAGVQCPTASVQSVKVAIKDCCDRIVGYEVRAPKMGERGFLQCRCAEKKSVQHDTIVTSKVVFFLEAAPDLAPTIDRPEAMSPSAGGDTAFLSVDFPPSVRPPATA